MESGDGTEPPASAVRPTCVDPVAPPDRRRGGAHPSRVRAVRGVRQRAGLALAPAGGAPSTGGGLGSMDRICRLDLSADPVGASPPPSRWRGRLRRRVQQPLPVVAALSGGPGPRGAMDAGVGILVLNSRVYGVLRVRRKRRARSSRRRA